jgi:osmoprotectant transport system ATP-binding protein
MDRSQEPMIRLDGVTKRFDDGTVAVHELDLDVPRGELVVLVGPSGCGKSTTLKMVNRLIEPTAGRILLDGEDMTHVNPVQVRRKMGYVIQQVGLFPHQRIDANVATVPRLLGWDKQRTTMRVKEMLELVGLEPDRFAKRYPHQLSGGQRQRVGVARALAADPPVLLMDEPFGAVDPIVRDRLQDEFLRLQKEVHKTILFVTHDLDEAVKLGDRIAVFREGGHLEQYDRPPTILAAPASDFVAEFVGGDRAIKRLSVTPVTRDDVEPLPPGGVDGMPTVPVDRTSLREALALMLSGDRGTVAVEDGGAPIGMLTPATVHAALRRSIDADAAIHLPRIPIAPAPDPGQAGADG